ncbi:GTP-binding protein [Patescibacteria group bacterium]|nr:GTP-binding protein [Patescibacteria group bacterium]
MSETAADKGVRPPIVAIVGHIDHGKSTLLDYIRKTNVVEAEAGGITQHLSAYEAVHKNTTGEHRITFLDTPGHEAFKAMRSRGLEVADVAILVVSAEDGVKPQTVETLKLIADTKIPYIVALTKIDKPDANVEKAKMSLLEHGVYLEGLGGNIPYVAISSKTGAGVPELLDLILLAAELEGISGDPAAPPKGVVLDAYADSKRGTTATLLVKNGTLESGQFVVAGDAWAPVRIMENFLGKSIQLALPGSPARVVGFSALPAAGRSFMVVHSKKEAEAQALANAPKKAGRPMPAALDATEAQSEEPTPHLVLPIVIKTDVAGMGDAVMHELRKLPQSEQLEIHLALQGVGPISENDVKLVGGGKTPGLIIGFNVKADAAVREAAERHGVVIGMFDVIYKLGEWLGKEFEARRPKVRTEERTAAAKVLKYFSGGKGKVVLGGRVEEGTLALGEEVYFFRRDLNLGSGTITNLQAQKKEVKRVEAGAEFGAQIKTSVEPAPGDKFEAHAIVFK